MITAQKSPLECPPASRLRAFAMGAVAEVESEGLMGHIELCDCCQQQLGSLDVSDDWLVRDLRPSDRNVFSEEMSEPECLEALLHIASHTLPPTFQIENGEQIGPYQLLKPLGIGGMGTVYLARHLRLNRDVAIKLLPRIYGNSPAWRERFDREMTAVASLEHPNIVRATDAGEAHGWHYLVMEYLDGLDLSRVLGRMGALGYADVCRIALDAAAGLAHVHSCGWIHRDIKPSNLILTRAGVTKLLDLGLVLGNESLLEQQNRLTTVGHLMGTVAFMSPEQLIDSGAVDARADVYSLAATMFRLLTGEDPHRAGANLPATILAKTTGPARVISSLVPSLPMGLAKAIDEALSMDPQLRPQSMLEFSDSIRSYAASAKTLLLIRQALKCVDDTEQPAHFAAQPKPTLAEADPSAVLTKTSSAKGRPPLRRVLFALLPWLVAILGIVVVVKTDQGEIIIESPEDNLVVNIKRSDEFVKQWTLKTGSNRTTLRSGTYVVELETQVDGWELSNDRVLLTRGSEESIAITQRSSASITAEQVAEVDQAMRQPMYQGKSFESWALVLKNERDIDIIGEAMLALITLAQTDDKKEQALKAILPTAREYGGFVASGAGLRKAKEEYEGFPMSQSQVYMSYFPTFMQTFLPEPGIAAFSDELLEGNLRSTMAITWALNNFVFGSEMGQTNSASVGFEVWRKMPENRASLEKLYEASIHATQTLDSASEVGGSQANHGITIQVHDRARRAVLALRLRFLQSLQQKLNKDPELAKFYLQVAMNQEIALTQGNSQNTTSDYVVNFLPVADLVEIYQDSHLPNLVTRQILLTTGEWKDQTAVAFQDELLNEKLDPLIVCIARELQQHPTETVAAINSELLKLKYAPPSFGDFGGLYAGGASSLGGGGFGGMGGNGTNTVSNERFLNCVPSLVRLLETLKASGVPYGPELTANLQEFLILITPLSDKLKNSPLMSLL